jgi:hypothetical protein
MPHQLPALNCPYCGMSMRYQWSEEARHFYRCLRHGLNVLHPDGRLEQDKPDDAAIPLSPSVSDRL